MSVTDYHKQLDAEVQDKYDLAPSVSSYTVDPETERLYDFVYNLNSAMRALHIHGRVNMDYKQYVVDMLTPETKAVLLELLNAKSS